MKPLRLLKIMLQSLSLHLPTPIRGAVVAALWGWEIARSAKFGVCVLDVKELVVADGARIGSLTSAIRVNQLRLGPSGRILNEVRIRGLGRKSNLSLDAHAAILSGHFIDLTDELHLGVGATLAGRGTQVWTHGRSLGTAGNPLTSCAVKIGDQAIVGASCIIVGVSIAPGCYVAAGSVVTRDLTATNSMYAGVPATLRKNLGTPAKPAAELEG